MSAGCMCSPSAVACVDARVPVRATYVNLYKWPESDAEFVKSVSSASREGGGVGRRRHHHHHHHQRQQYQHPRVVDSYSCRQMFLRSYTFSRKETEPERTRKCLGKVKEKVADAGKKVPGCVPWVAAVPGDGDGGAGVASGDGRPFSKKKKKKRCRMMRRLREASTAALCAVFHRLLSCTSTVDVASHSPPF